MCPGYSTRSSVHRVVLHIPSSILDKLLGFMDEPFPILEHLSISSTAETTSLILPETFLAPNLRHLTLSGISLPVELTLPSLVTLALTDIQTSSYFLAEQLVAHLQSFSQLEELSIGFSIPLPRPSAEMELSNALETPVTLLVSCSGGSALTSSPKWVPLLEQLNISPSGLRITTPV
jgi:hypothetical protein